jgi:hypothetical protein
MSITGNQNAIVEVLACKQAICKKRQMGPTVDGG